MTRSLRCVDIRFTANLKWRIENISQALRILRHVNVLSISWEMLTGDAIIGEASEAQIIELPALHSLCIYLHNDFWKPNTTKSLEFG